MSINSLAPSSVVSKSVQALRNMTQKGFFHLLSANFIIQFIGFGSQLLVIKFLTPVEMGNIKTLQSFTSVASVLAGFGFSASVLKLCSEKRSPAEKASIFKKSFLYTLLPVALTLIAIAILAHFQLFSPVREVNQWMYPYMLTIPLGVLAGLIMVYLQALKKIQLMAKLQVLIRVIGVVMIIGLTYFIGFPGYITGTVVAGALALIPLIYLTRSDFRARADLGGDSAVFMRYATWSFSANLVNTVSVYVDIFMLNYLVDDRVSLGYYSIATVFFTGLTQIAATVQTITTPYFSERSGDRGEFVRVFRKYQRLMVVGSFVVAAGAMVILPVFMRLIFGPQYGITGGYIQILCVRYFLVSCYAIIGVAIFSLGRMDFNFYSSCITMVVAIALSYPFTKLWGIWGAASAQIFSSIVMLIVMSFMLRSLLKAPIQSRDLPTSDLHFTT